MALFAEQVPENHGEFVGHVIDADFLGPLNEGVLRLAYGGDAGEIALDVGREYRHAGARKTLSKNLQRNGLSGSRCAGNQSVTICQGQREILGLGALAHEDRAVLIDLRHP